MTMTFTLELPVWKLQTVCVSVRAHACVGERKRERESGWLGACACVRACMYFESVCNTALSRLQSERHSPLSIIP